MPRLTAPATAMATLLSLMATPLAAQSMDMSDAERTAFRAEIRAYLMENPEVIFEAVAEFERRNAVAQAEMDATLVEINADEIFNDGHSWVGGNPDGDVTLVEFMDYRCSYCRRAYTEVEQLLEFDGNIRFVVKEFPILGEESVLASRFAIAARNVAGDDAYKSVHDALMITRGGITVDSLSRMADELDLDGAAIMAAMDAPEVAAELNANRALAQKLDINGTPSFILEEEMLRGYVPLARMQELVTSVRAQ
jgi:protein-disulfide isomerase